MIPILKLCDSCVFYTGPDTNTCKAYPEGIPLKSDDTHFDPIEGQVGETVYEMDESKYETFDIYRRIHPGIRFPILLTYDIPEEDEALTQKTLEVEPGRKE